jgi:hypothetical protein
MWEGSEVRFKRKLNPHATTLLFGGESVSTRIQNMDFLEYHDLLSSLYTLMQLENKNARGSPERTGISVKVGAMFS